MTANAYATLQSAAIPIIAQSLLYSNIVEVSSFQLGDAYGFTLDPNSTGVKNSSVFTGNTTFISSNLINNELSYIISLDNSLGNFSFGNVMVFLNYAGESIPFLQMIFPQIIQKIADNTATGVVGNYIVIEFTVNLISSIVQANYTVNITDNDIAVLPSISTELSLPTPSPSVFQQYIVDSATATNRPAIAIRRSLDNKWYGNGLIQRIGDSRFGSINGGIEGDGYADFNGLDIWGGFFDTSSNDYTITIDGGASWAISSGDVYDGRQF